MTGRLECGGSTPLWFRGSPLSRKRQNPAWLLFLALWVGVVVGHGCHAGDHDDELRMTRPVHAPRSDVEDTSARNSSSATASNRSR